MNVLDKSAILALIMIKKILKLMFCTQTQSYGPPAGGESLEGSELIYICVFKSSANIFYGLLNLTLWSQALSQLRFKNGQKA